MREVEKDRLDSKSAALEAAKKRGDKRTADVRERVKAAMSTIELEMVANEGIYPHRNGALSSAEVARRAGVHPTTFHTDKLKDLGAQVRGWLEEVKKVRIVGSVNASRTLAERRDDWKHKYEGLLQSHRDTELELQEAQYQLEEARKTAADLERQIATLRAAVGQAAESNVSQLRPKGSK